MAVEWRMEIFADRVTRPGIKRDGGVEEGTVGVGDGDISTYEEASHMSSHSHLF